VSFHTEIDSLEERTGHCKTNIAQATHHTESYRLDVIN